MLAGCSMLGFDVPLVNGFISLGDRCSIEVGQIKLILVSAFGYQLSSFV